MLGLLTLGIVAYFQGVTILRVATNKGELIVEVDTDDVEVTIKQGGAVIVDRKKDRTFVLTAKGGEVEFFDPGTGVRLLTKEFKLERGGKTVLRAREELAKERLKEPVKPGPGASNRRRFPPNQPLSPLGGLVTRPASIPGVASWTIETIWDRGGNAQLVFDPSGERAAINGRGTIRIYDTRHGRLKQALVGGSWQQDQNMAWSKDGRFLAKAAAGDLTIWDTKNGKRIRSFERNDAWSLAWSPDGKLLAISIRHGVEILDPFKGEKLDRFEVVDLKGNFLG